MAHKIFTELTENNLYQWRMKQKLSPKEIADKVGCSIHYIYHQLSKYKISFREINLIGKNFHQLTVIKKSYKKRNQQWWMCQCSCGKEICLTSGRINRQDQKSCGCIYKKKEYRQYNQAWKGYKEISGSWWNALVRNGKSRNLEFEITIEDIWDKFLEQNRKCIFTGENLFFDIRYTDRKSNASLDRIDSSKGYLKNNIQWTTKDLNKMKWSKTSEEFIDLCKKVAKYHSN